MSEYAPRATIVRARHVWIAPGRTLSPGEVHIDADGRVAHVAAVHGRAVEPWLIAPGLVNAHVHLQLPALPVVSTDFFAWVRSVIAWQRQPDAPAQRRARTRASIAELLRSGCTAVGEIDAFGSSPQELARGGMTGRCYQEVIGFNLDASQSQRVVTDRWQPGTRACASGLSPHAPYSCSPLLVRAAHRRTAFLAMHVAEIAAEVELLAHGTGACRTLLRELGKWPRHFAPPHCSSVAWLRACGALGPRSLLVHLQEIGDDDLRMVRSARAPVAVCPATIDYFQRTPPDVVAWQRAGIVVGLGTDSRASSRGPLSMVDSMAIARRLWPALSPEAVLAMATVHAARAIGRPSLGRISVGGRADLCAFNLPGAMSMSAALEAATTGVLRVGGTWLRGLRVVARDHGTRVPRADQRRVVRPIESANEKRARACALA